MSKMDEILALLKDIKRLVSGNDKPGVYKKLPEHIRQAVWAFLQKNPDPSDDDIRSWAARAGYDPEYLDDIFYEFSTERANQLDIDDEQNLIQK